jgi:signal peptidase II
MESFLKKIFLVILVLVSCVGCDQRTKGIAIQHLSGTKGISYLHDLFRLQYSENTGAFLSLGAGLADNAKFWIFTVSVAIILVGLLTYILISSQISTSSLISISMVIGGGISNLFDRVVNNGAVVDFMNIGIGTLRTGIFNFADVAITLGTFLLILFNTGIFEKNHLTGKVN